MSGPVDTVVDHRPWGKLTRYIENEEATVRIISIRPRQKISTQVHKYRDEFWVALDDGLEVTVDKETTILNSGDEIFIPRKTVHTAKNSAHIGTARILEIVFGIFYEDDKIRIIDRYGRS